MSEETGGTDVKKLVCELYDIIIKALQEPEVQEALKKEPWYVRMAIQVAVKIIRALLGCS